MSPLASHLKLLILLKPPLPGRAWSPSGLSRGGGQEGDSGRDSQLEQRQEAMMESGVVPWSVFAKPAMVF